MNGGLDVWVSGRARGLHVTILQICVQTWTCKDIDEISYVLLIMQLKAL